jgi:hypothetical protein
VPELFVGHCDGCYFSDAKKIVGKHHCLGFIEYGCNNSIIVEDPTILDTEPEYELD